MNLHRRVRCIFHFPCVSTQTTNMPMSEHALHTAQDTQSNSNANAHTRTSHTRILWDRCHLALSRTCRCGERARRRSERKRASGPPRTNTHVKDFHCTAETEKQKGERQTWKTKSAYRTLFVTPHCWHLFRKYALASFSPRPPRETKKNRSPSVDFRRVKPSSSHCPSELYPQRERKKILS